MQASRRPIGVLGRSKAFLNQVVKERNGQNLLQANERRISKAQSVQIVNGNFRASIDVSTTRLPSVGLNELQALVQIREP
jgi:hypothetical protein